MRVDVLKIWLDKLHTNLSTNDEASSALNPM